MDNSTWTSVEAECLLEILVPAGLGSFGRAALAPAKGERLSLLSHRSVFETP